MFEQLVLSDSRFEILGKVSLGLVCFRLKVSFSALFGKRMNPTDLEVLNSFASKRVQTYSAKISCSS